MTLKFALPVALWLLLTITPNPILASSQPQGMTIGQWVILVKAYSMAYGVDPNLALALARCESEKGKTPLSFRALWKILVAIRNLSGLQGPQSRHAWR